MNIGVSTAHYERAQGAVYGDITEYQLSLEWSRLLRKKLTDLGYPVCWIEDERLPDKVKHLNSGHCDLVLEIHFNACGGCGASGCETLYYPGSVSGKAVAAWVQVPLVAAMNNRDRGVKEGWYKMDRPGIIDFPGDKENDETPNYFLSATNCTALIIEPEFIEKMVPNDPRMEAATDAIVSGVLGYFSDGT